MKKRLVLVLLASVLLVGCVSSKVSSLPIANQVKHSVKVIVFAPGGG